MRRASRPEPGGSNRRASGHSSSTTTRDYRTSSSRTGTADAAGDWWEPLIGRGRALDTDRFGVVCANLLGGRYGSTGPTSIDPRTGRPYGHTFPPVTTRDQALASWALLDAIGIERLAL